MDGKFITAVAMERDHLDWGVMGWLSRPATTGAKDLVVIEVTLEPGCGHNFHKHPGQEEVIYVVAGAVEQWVETLLKTTQLKDSRKDLSATYPAQSPLQIPIDYIFHSPELSCEQIKTQGGTTSNHLGIIGYYNFKTPGNKKSFK